MDRKKASDFHPRVLALFDAYIHGGISRRDFLDSKRAETANRVQQGCFSSTCHHQRC